MPSAVSTVDGRAGQAAEVVVGDPDRVFRRVPEGLQKEAVAGILHARVAQADSGQGVAHEESVPITGRGLNRFGREHNGVRYGPFRDKSSQDVELCSEGISALTVRVSQGQKTDLGPGFDCEREVAGDKNITCDQDRTRVLGPRCICADRSGVKRGAIPRVVDHGTDIPEIVRGVQVRGRQSLTELERRQVKRSLEYPRRRSRFVHRHRHTAGLAWTRNCNHDLIHRPNVWRWRPSP